VRAPLIEFLSPASFVELQRAGIEVRAREEQLLAVQRLYAVEFPGPIAPPAPPPPIVLFPATPPLPPMKQVLVRLKIDRVNFKKRPPGEPCPCCARPLIYTTIAWPGGERPEGKPESAWFCSWCRQSYVYTYVTTPAAQKVS
jgi:hypothetical protein